MRLFAQKQAPDFAPAGIGQKAEARRKAGTGLRFAAGLARVAAMRGPLDSRRPCTTLVPQERRRRPLRGIFEAVCPLPRPESRPRLGASAGQGAPAEAISRRMSYHVHTYIRSRAGCFVARPRAYALTARCITHMLFRCSIARYAYTLADGTDPLPKLLMLYCASARISCIDFDCSARRASQNEAKALCCARAHIRPDADGPPDRGSRRTVPPEGRPAFRLIVNTAEKPCAFVRGSPAHAGRIGGRARFPAAPLSSGRSAGYGRKTAFD